MSEAETEVQAEDTTYTVDTETGEILDESPGEPLEEETEDEPAEDEEPHEEAPTEETGASAIRTPADAKKFKQDIERLRKDVAGRVGRIYAEDANDLIECPLCAMDAPGYFVSPDKRPLHEEQVSFFRALLNMPVPTEYSESPYYSKCPSCTGKGRVRTGSEVQNEELVMCPRCQGHGWVRNVPEPVDSGNGYHEADEGLVTGPTVFGHEIAPTDTALPPNLQVLKDEGWAIIPPLAAPRPAV